MFYLRSVKKKAFVVMILNSFVCYTSYHNFVLDRSQLEEIPHASFRNYRALQNLDTRQKLCVFAWSDKQQSYCAMRNDRDFVPDGRALVVMRKEDDTKGILRNCPLFQTTRPRTIKLYLPHVDGITHKI